jgi:hypothetical protein
MIITPGNSYALGAPNIYIVEAASLPSTDFNNGVNKVGIVGESNFGPATGVTRIKSLGEAIAIFGNRQTGSLIKQIETFFNETGGGENAGAELWVRRVVSETGGVTADRDITAGTDTITISAKYPGTFGNSIYTQIDATGVTTFDLTITLGSVGDEWYYSQTYTNLTNTSTDERYFIDVITNDPYVDVTKSGTGSTIPATDASPVALSGGTDYTVADGNYVTCLQDLKSVANLRGVFFDKETTSALYTGLKNFCESNDVLAIGIASVEDDSTIAAVVAEMATKTSRRLVTTYPLDYQYYNVEDDAFEDLAIGWAAGVIFRYRSNFSPILKPLKSNFGTAVSDSDLIALSEVNVFVGGYRVNVGSCVVNGRLETREQYFKDISMTRRMMDVEADIDSQLALYLGTVASSDQAQSDIIGMLTTRLNYWTREGWITGWTDENGVFYPPFEISFPDFDITRFNSGILDVTVKVWLAPTIEHIIIKMYRNQ